MEAGALVKTLFQDNPTKPDYRYYIRNASYLVIGFYLHFAGGHIDFQTKFH